MRGFWGEGIGKSCCLFNDELYEANCIRRLFSPPSQQFCKEQFGMPVVHSLNIMVLCLDFRGMKPILLKFLSSYIVL